MRVRTRMALQHIQCDLFSFNVAANANIGSRAEVRRLADLRLPTAMSAYRLKADF